MFIPDDKSYIDEFSSISIAYIDGKILDFLRFVGVKNVTEVIKKSVRFIGTVTKTDYSKKVERECLTQKPLRKKRAKN